MSLLLLVKHHDVPGHSVGSGYYHTRTAWKVYMCGREFPLVEVGAWQLVGW